MGFPLSQEQRQVVDDRGGQLLVSAAAGSGKTRVLVERLLDRVAGEGLDLTDFLVITYTKAAAAELRGRIAQALSKRLAQSPSDRRLRRQSALVYRAQISTIHSLCAVLLRENGHLLDINPDFRLCDEAEGRMLMDQVLTDVMERQYENLAPGADFAQLVDTLSAGRDDSALEEIVRSVFVQVQSHRDPEGWLREQSRLWELEGVTGAEDTAWGTLLLAQSRRQARFCLERLEEALALTDRDGVLSGNYGESLAVSVEGTRRLLDGLDQGWDATRAALPVPFPTAKRKSGVEDLEALERVKSLRDRCKKQLSRLEEIFAEDSAALLDALRDARPAVRGLMALVGEFAAAFRAEKDRRGLMDFSDLEHFTARLLERDGGPTPLAQSWSARLAEVMVDEYQDTNQVQNVIFTALSDGGRKLFLVGDVKQSIYRFRLADPTIFLEKYRSFFPPDQAGEGEPRRRVLSRNFRSRPEILEGVNDLFRSIMSRQLGELDYTQDHALFPGREEYPEPAQPVELAVLDLACLGELEEGEHKDFLEARYAAQRIEELMDRYDPGDIMILLRSPSGSIRHYIRALEERNIPWSAESSEDFFATTEVQVALAILRIVDNPRQDVALLAALRSPVYGFSADRLAVLRSQARGDFYQVLVQNAQKGAEDCREFLRELEELRFQSGERTARELIWYVYEGTNLLGLFGAMDNGEKRQHNLLSLYALAGRLEEGGCLSLFQFLLRIDRLRAAGKRMNLPGEDVRQGGVSILSIHRSKGLEKPVVLVCGLSKQFNQKDIRQRVLFHPVLGVGPTGLDRRRMVEYPTLARQAVAVQRRREMLSEEMRLLYVAMTRAQEKLILTVGLREGRKKLARLGEDASVPLSPMALERQESLGAWVLLHALTRPEGDVLRRAAGLEETVAPGLGTPWDIRLVPGEPLLKGEVRPTEGQSPAGAEGELDLNALLSWIYPYASACTAPSKVTATQLKGRSVDQEAAEEAEQVYFTAASQKPLSRPAFAAQEQGLTPAQRGSAIHLAMQYLPLEGDGSVDWVSKELERLTREGFLTPLQSRAVDPALLSAFVRSPLGREMARAPMARREFKFSLLTPRQGEEVLLQGIVDAWFGDETGVTVLDFKSDRVNREHAQERAETYRPQLEAYAGALERILGLPVKRRVIWFFRLEEAVEI